MEHSTQISDIGELREEDKLRILLTGMTGNSGKSFLKSIKRYSAHLKYAHYRILVRSASRIGLIDQSGLGVEIACGDSKSDAFLDEAMKDVDTVFHVAGIRSSVNIVRAAIRQKVKWVVVVHTTGIYSKYKSASAEYKRIEQMVETLASDARVPLTILRPAMIYGTISDGNIAVFIKMVDRLKIFPVVDHAEFSLQPVHFEDLAEAYCRVLMNEEITKGKSYNLSGKEPILLMDIFRTIARLLAKSPFFISIPSPIAYLGALLLYGISFKRIDFREKVQRLVEPRVFSHEAAARDFGYSPMSFEEGVVNEIADYKALSRKR